MDVRTLSGVWKSRVDRVIGGRWDLYWYALRARLAGLDLGSVSVEELGLSPDRSVFHDNSGGPDLRRVLQQIDIPAGSVALDYGSGKGGAVITLSEFPFAEVLGVEISPELIAVAEANMRRAGVRKARFIASDAAAFTNLDRVTHVYMYHPFRAEVMTAVLSHLGESLRRRPRPVTLIYKNPVHHDAVVLSQVFRFQRAIRLGSRSDTYGLVHIYL